MPANLTPDYHKAEEWCCSASTNAEKLLALEEMLAVMGAMGRCHRHGGGTQGQAAHCESAIRRDDASFTVCPIVYPSFRTESME
jgi:hypothetical protein